MRAYAIIESGSNDGEYFERNTEYFLSETKAEQRMNELNTAKHPCDGFEAWIEEIEIEE